MSYFSMKEKTELVRYLRSVVSIHDADLRQIWYDPSEKTLKIVLYNSIYKSEVRMQFYGVCLFLSTGFDPWGMTNQTVSVLVLEEEDILIAETFKQFHQSVSNKLHFLFELFSGNQIHIVAENIAISETAQGGNR